MTRKSTLFVATVLLTITNAATAAEKKETKPIEIPAVKHDGPVDFEKEVLPILRRNCLACHNATDAESDLVLETPQSILEGGFEGPAAVAGKGAESLLVKVSAHLAEPHMPPADNEVGAKPLTPQQLGLIKLWIDQGAKGELKSGGGPISWHALSPYNQPVYTTAISPYGRFVAAGRGNQIYVYGVESGVLLSKLQDPKLAGGELYKDRRVAHLDVVQSLAFSPDGRLLASGGYRTIKIWQRPETPKVADVAGLGEVTSLATSNDGKWAAAGEADGQVKLIDLEQNKVARTLSGHSAAVTGLGFSPDGATLATGSKDKTLRTWTTDGKETGQIELPGEVTAVTLFDGGKHVAAAAADNKIYTYPATLPEEAAPVKELAGHGGAIHTLVVVPNQPNQIISGSEDGTARSWDAVAGRQLRSFNHGQPVADVAVSTDGKQLATAGKQNSAKLFTLSNGQQVAELKGGFRKRLEERMLALEANLANQKINNIKKDLDEAQKRLKSEEENGKKAEETLKTAKADYDKKVEAAKKPEADLKKADEELAKAKEALDKVQAEQKKLEDQITPLKEELKKAEDALKAAKEDKAKADAQKKVDDLKTKLKPLEDQKKKVDDEVNKANSEFKKAESEQKKIATPAKKAIDERTAAERAFKAAERSVERSKIAIDKAKKKVPEVEGKLKAAEEAKKKIDAELAESRKQVPTLAKPFAAVAFSSDGTVLATGGADGTVYTWSTESGAPIDAFEIEGGEVTALAFTSSGQVLSITGGKSAAVLDTSAPWKLIRTIGDPGSPDQLADRVTALDFSDDGKMLASGGGEPSRSGELKLWNVADGKLIREIEGAHSDTVCDVDFGPDGAWIASGGADRFAKIHEVATGKWVRSFEGHTHHVLGVGFKGDGRILATSGADAAIKIWNARTGDQIKTVSGFKKEVTGLDWIGAEDYFVVSSGDPQVTSKRSNGGNVRGYSGMSGFVHSVDVSRDGETMVAGGQDGVVRVWQVKDGAEIATFQPPQPPAPEGDKQAAN